ncbi:hypothetical protein FSP39_024150 [Pinctada imbricata]|uniref:Solute carrier family 40 member n=1 Tax=Pinctada imbricata TaxID=66713 RepID=A0AA88YNF7_PINIB|nr:hypothetical protein FSP39_024150 [Pinctada imbricata]
MWSFGIGLFLINFSPESLLLTAIYGFSTGGAVFLFGAVAGDLVDKTPRFKAVRTTLIVRKVSLCLCACLICIVHWFKNDISAAGSDNVLLYISYFGIIVIGVISNLANIARRIAVERDWVVEICERKKNRLAAMTATMRAIDLIAQVLTPLIIGQVIDVTEIGYGAVLVAGWNLFAIFIEIFVAWKVYISVPSLKSKMYKPKTEDKPNWDKKDIADNLTDTEENLEEKSSRFFEIDNDTINKENGIVEIKKQNDHKGKEDIHGMNRDKHGDIRCINIVQKIFSNVTTLYKGWKIYRKYDVAYAGLSAAFLFMTVLSFDSITVGFGYSQGLSAATLGQLRAGVAAAGIIGTIFYPRVRKCISTEYTGIASLAFQIISLTLCVASVFTPGSPFDLSSTQDVDHIRDFSSENLLNVTNNNYSIAYDILPNISEDPSNVNMSDISVSIQNNSISKNNTDINFKDDTSIWFLMSGIIASRIGLVMVTLAIQQLFLERVKEEERGIVGGVQSTLNWLLDMLKFVIVIFLPHPNQYGLLVIISFSFICMAFVLYVKFLCTSKTEPKSDIEIQINDEKESL